MTFVVVILIAYFTIVKINGFFILYNYFLNNFFFFFEKLYREATKFVREFQRNNANLYYNSTEPTLKLKSFIIHVHLY